MALHILPAGRLTSGAGDPQGIGLVAEVCQPERRGKSGHFLVEALARSEVDSETAEYLKSRGDFDLPPFNVCQSLVRLYFHHVHPFFPVLDASAFLEAFERKDEEHLSLHLLWSVFLAAANVSSRYPGFSLLEC